MARLGSRLLVALGVISGAVALIASPAAAHALPVSSDPPAGATLKQAPAVVTVTFGEQPDPKLSGLRILDVNSQDHARGSTQAVPGNPLALRVSVGRLTNGVYTVAWHTLSRVDGHLASGAFAFGVGVTAGPAAAQSGFGTRSVTPSGSSVISRWLLYVGLMLLLGASVVGLFCFRELPGRLGWLLACGWVLAVAGAVAIGLDAWHAAHFSFSRLLGSSIGHQLLGRLVPLVAAAVALALWFAPLVPRSRRPRRVLTVLVALSGLWGMWGDVSASHASGVHSWRYARMNVQLVHFAAAGLWVGGLIALLVTISAVSGDERLRAARRFSAVALGAVIAIAASGTQRALDEVGTLRHLFHTAFGQFVVVKSGLLLLLVVLGALNRYRSVPAAARSSRPLQVIGRTEMVLLAGVLVAAGFLQGLAPASSTATPAATKPVVLTGHDFGTTVRVTLLVSPGTAGFNQFTVTVVDFDTKRPVDDPVALRFAMPNRPDLGESTLNLARIRAGTYTASGANLSIDGTWSLTTRVEEPTGGVEIPFTLTTRQPPEKITVQRFKGLPTTYTLHLAGNRSVQTYLDPGHPAVLDEFHVTFIGPDGNELPMAALAVSASPPGPSRPTVSLPVRPLDDIGHFVADLSRPGTGSYRFDVTGTTQTGDTIHGVFTIPVA